MDLLLHPSLQEFCSTFRCYHCAKYPLYFILGTTDLQLQYEYFSADSDKIAPAQPKEDVIDGLSSDTPKKKPAGAVSMFGAGGGELLAALSKKR